MNMKICDIKITNPDKIICGSTTKLDVINYYKDIAPKLLPFTKDRYISEVRCHSGFDDCFFKKHPEKDQSDLIEIATKHDLISEVQLGSIEIHPYSISGGTSFMVFDLDPDTNLSIDSVRQGALHLKEILEKCNLISFLKTSGGKGYHIVVPIKNVKNTQNFEEFAQKVAVVLEKSWPKLYTTNIRKDHRKGKVFIDYLRNKKGATCVAPYSLRARENLPISMPIDWRDLENILPNAITIQNYKNFIAPNPWQNFFLVHQLLR